MRRAVFLDFGDTIVSLEKDPEAHRLFAERLVELYSLNIDPSVIVEAVNSNIYMSDPGSEYIPIREQLREILSRKLGLSLDWSRVARLYYEAHAEVLEPYPDSISALEELRSLVDAMAIVSDADSEYVHQHLEVLGVKDMFDVIVTSEDVGFTKPNRVIFMEALRRTGAEPPRSMHAGDNPERDVVGAKIAGLKAVLVSRGKRKPCGLEDACVDNLKELVRLVEELL